MSLSLPAIRFKDDRGNDFSEWEEKTLGGISHNVGYGMNAAATEFDGVTKYIRITDINATSNKFSPDPLTSPDEEAGDQYKLQSGDIVFARTGASVGKSYLYDEADGNLAFAGFLIRFSIYKDVANPVVVFLQTQTHGYWKWVKVNSMRSGQPGINAEEYKTLPLQLPTLPEQRKIADFLTAVDGRIGQMIQKKALLEDYKKGVMQQLFTQAIRFKDDHGNDFPDWEEKRYDSVYSFKNTNSYSRDLLIYEDGEVRNIHYGDIHTKFKSNFVLKDELVPFIRPDVELKRISDDCYLRENDLVIADASEDYNDVGKCIEVRDLDGERTLAGLHTFIARPKKAAMAPGFGGYLMQAREVRLKIMTIAQGTKVLGISKTQLCKVLLPIPSPDEQTKIADFLSSIDRKIESVAAQITETQTFKCGLLQQMFV
jgi:type I restriction enzyme, S subunit